MNDDGKEMNRSFVHIVPPVEMTIAKALATSYSQLTGTMMPRHTSQTINSPRIIAKLDEPLSSSLGMSQVPPLSSTPAPFDVVSRSKPIAH